MDDELQAPIEAVNNQLREKLASKFQTAVFLAGFSITLLGIEISMLWGPVPAPPMLPFAIPMLIFAVVLHGIGIVLFDGLTMPKPFWPLGREDDPLREKSANERVNAVLYAERGQLRVEDILGLKEYMVFYWSYLVVIALIATAISLALVLLPWGPLAARDPHLGITAANAAIGFGCAVVYGAIIATRKRGPYGPLAIFD